jgi:nucleoside-diphosphate-sugar epimerase
MIIEEDIQYILKQPLPWEQFKNKTVLITGGYGMLAAYLVEVLLTLNIKVIAIVRNIEKAKNRFSKYSNKFGKDLVFIIKDIMDPIDIDYADFIVHAASIASPLYFGKNPVEVLTSNIVGTLNLLQIPHKRFMYISSCAVYGTPYVDNITEDDYGYIDILKVRSCYEEGKRAGENLCISWAYTNRNSVVIARPAHIYGPGMREDDGRVFADFVYDIVNNRNISIRSDGTEIRSFCYIADAIIGFCTILLKGDDNNAYNISNPNCSVSILKLANTLVGLYPEKNLKVISKEHAPTYLKSSGKAVIPDISKLRALGWNPTTTIPEGFKRTIDYIKEENLNNL